MHVDAHQTPGARVLIRVPSRVDAELAVQVLEEAGMPSHLCADVEELCEGIDENVGAALVAEEALGPEAIARLDQRLCVQPAWSDIPLVVLVSRRRTGLRRHWPDEIRGSTHVVTLPRPLHRTTLVSAIRSALEARRRQLIIRDALRAREEREAALEESRRELARLTATLEERVRERTEVAERRADSMRRLALQLGETERVERRRLASILHDDLQQLLLAAHMQVGALASKVPDELRERVEKLDELLESTMHRARTLSHELSPPVLVNTDLKKMFAWLAEWFEQNHELRVELETAEDLPALGEHERAFLFAGTREVLVNAIKHANASHAGLLVTCLEGELVVEVSDAGEDFDPAAVERAIEGRSGLGLVHVRERVEALGGRMEVRNSPTGGGLFSFHLPVPEVTVGARRAPARSAAAPPTRRGETEETSGVRHRPDDLETGPPIRVQVVDDHTAVREGIVTILEEHADIEVVGEAADGHEAVADFERLRPDVVVMDVQMPRGDGVAATRTILTRWPGAQVVALSARDDIGTREAMRTAGACAFVSKGAPLASLVEAIRQVHRSRDREDDLAAES